MRRDRTFLLPDRVLSRNPIAKLDAVEVIAKIDSGPDFRWR